MCPKEYINDRLNDQIRWYSNKSSSAQQIYKILRLISIVLSASIPLIIGLVSINDLWQYVIGIMGVIITVIEGWLSLAKYHENWIEYRSISEFLKHEKYMYLTKTGIYRNDDNFKYLVERVENIISKENINWSNMNKNSERENTNEE